MKVKMTKARDTKGTYVYAADEGKSAGITSIYIRKDSVKGDPPESITLEIKEITAS